MNILLCFNDRFTPLARVLIISLMCHHRDLHFYVGYINLNAENRANLKELVEGSCPSGNWPWDDGAFRKESVNRTIEFIEFKPLTTLQTCGRFGLDTWTRCFIWEQIPVDRLLYLDADIVVDGNLEQFYYDDLGDNLIKACPDYALYGYGPNNSRFARFILAPFQEQHGYPNRYGHYCNAGVVLFNLARMREEGLTAPQFVEYCNKLTKPLRMNDQDFINLYFEGRIKFANPYRYNLETPPLSYMKRRDFSSFENLDFSESPMPATDIQPEAMNQHGATFDPAKIIIYHYASEYKPNSWRYHEPYPGVYWKYRYLDLEDKSKHLWTRIGQNCRGFWRCHILHDHPFDFVKRIKGGHSPWETPKQDSQT